MNEVRTAPISPDLGQAFAKVRTPYELRQDYVAHNLNISRQKLGMMLNDSVSGLSRILRGLREQGLKEFALYDHLVAREMQDQTPETARDALRFYTTMKNTNETGEVKNFCGGMKRAYRRYIRTQAQESSS